MTTFQRERFRAIEHELWPLWKRHWQLSAVNREIQLSPNYEQYRALDDAGVLHIVTARREGALVGYWFNFIMRRAMHYGIVEAHPDIYYMDCRDAPMAVMSRYRALCRAMLEEMRKENVRRVFIVTKDHADLSPVWESMGFQLVEHVHSLLL